MNDPWQLIQAGQYREAIAASSELISNDNSGFHYYNRSRAYILLEQYEEAFRDIEVAESFHTEEKEGYFYGDSGSLWLGTVEWLMGKHQQAGDRWLRIGNALAKNRVRYSDASGGVGTASIIRFGAALLKRSDLKDLTDKLFRKLIKRPSYHCWPLSIAPFLTSKITSEELLATVSSTPILRERQLCQAYFALAVDSYEKGRFDLYADHMASAASLTVAIHEEEFFLAKYELRRLKLT